MWAPWIGKLVYNSNNYGSHGTWTTAHGFYRATNIVLHATLRMDWEFDPLLPGE